MVAKRTMVSRARTRMQSRSRKRRSGSLSGSSGATSNRAGGAAPAAPAASSSTTSGVSARDSAERRPAEGSGHFGSADTKGLRVGADSVDRRSWTQRRSSLRRVRWSGARIQPIWRAMPGIRLAATWRIRRTASGRPAVRQEGEEGEGRQRGRGRAARGRLGEQRKREEV
jgi:hypothetical protein